MNKQYIQDVIVKGHINTAFNEMQKIFNICNDGSPESIKVLELIVEAQNAIYVVENHLEGVR